MLTKSKSGDFCIPFVCSIDNRGLYEAIRSEDVAKLPQEESLILQVQCVRDDLVSGRLAGLFWIDTRDMLADGLNKGGLDRTPLQTAMAQCKWILNHEYVQHTVKKSVVAAHSSSSTEQQQR